MRLFAIGTFMLALFATSTADARHRHLTHKFGHYLAYRHFHHQHPTYFARRRQHRDAVHVGLTRTTIDGGQTIIVASSYAERFIGFFHALFTQFGHLPEVGCYSPTGHMRNSLHHWGGACDVGQSRRNVAWHPMYHISILARRWGLQSGEAWHNPDAGHVEVDRKVTDAMIPDLVMLRQKRPKISWAWAAPL